MKLLYMRTLRSFVLKIPLTLLKSKLLEMSSLVESAVYRSITVVVQKDEALANDVLKNEGASTRLRSRLTNSP
jgi:hypothetical protein